MAIYYQKILALDIFRIIIIVILLSIATGIHGMSHLGLEDEYNYNPFNMLTPAN